MNIYLANKAYQVVENNFATISPFYTLSIQDGVIVGTKQIDNKLLSISLNYGNNDEAIEQLSKLSSLTDDAFKLYCSLAIVESEAM